jgi:hypothetical protein
MITASATAGEPSAFAITVFWVALFLAYWAPAVVALVRRVPNLAQIIAVNFFAFFFLIPWVVALVWALKPAESRAA